MDSKYHQMELNSGPAEQGGVPLSGLAHNPGIQVQPSAPLYYEVDSQGPNVPPPAYNSLFDNAVAFPKTMKQNFMNNIRGTNTAPATEAHDRDEGAPRPVNIDADANANQNNDDSDDTPDTCGEIMCLCIATNIFFCALPIAEIVMGYLYKDDCPINDKIPLFLLVNGIVFTLAFQQIWIPSKGCSENLLLLLLGMAGLFLFAWFICGSVWVFKAKSEVVLYDSKPIELPIEGPFRSTAFSIVTSAPLTGESMLIQWKDDSYWNPQKADMRLKISYLSLYYCNSTQKLGIVEGGHVFKKQDVWTFYITTNSVSVWLNGKEAYSQFRDIKMKDCQLWKTDLDIIETLTGPVHAIRSYDSENVDQELCCNKTVYNFAFWLLIVGYIIVGLLLFYVVML